MDSPAARQLLKVLSGPHAGGEVLLADGVYTLGSSDASEIVLTDTAIAPRHAQLSIRGGRIECRALGGARILVDGAGTDGAQLAAYQCFTLGATHLAVGPADGNWPPIGLPQSQSPEPLVASLDAEARADAAEAPSDQSPRAEAAAASSAPMAAPSAPANAAKPSARGIWIVVAAAVLLIGGFLGLLGWLSSGGTPEAPIASRKEQQAALEIAVRDLGFRDLITVSDMGGRFTATGHVPTPADKKAVREALYVIDRGIRLRVYDSETLVSSVADALRMYKLDFTASAGEPGEVRVGGVLKDVPQWTKIRQRIKTDMPHLVALTEHFSNVAKPDTAIQEASPTSSAADGATVPAETVAAAPAAAPPAAAWLGPSLPPIHSVSVGNYQALTLTNGEHIFRGAVLESGYTVTEITANRVVLTRDGRQHIIKIGI